MSNDPWQTKSPLLRATKQDDLLRFPQSLLLEYVGGREGSDSIAFITENDICLIMSLSPIQLLVLRGQEPFPSELTASSVEVLCDPTASVTE